MDYDLYAPRNTESEVQRATSTAGSHFSELSDLSRSGSQIGESSQRPRSALEQDLKSIRSSLRGIQDLREVPDKTSVLELDAALLPIAVKAENLRSAEKCWNAGMPHTPLHHFPLTQAFCAAVSNGDLRDGRVIFKLNEDSPHVVSADVRSVNSRVSILIVEPVDHDSTRELLKECLKDMARLLPEDAMVSVLIHNSQKNKVDCPVFALHGASKMLEERQFFDTLHAENVSEQNSGEDSVLSQQKQTPVGQYRIIDAHTILPTAFYKHAQSKSAIRHAFKDRPEALHEPVNKKNETLLTRMEKNSDYRLSVDFNRKVSTSMENKRIAYVARARDYVKISSDDEVHEMTAESADTAPDWFAKSRAAMEAESDS